MDTLLKSFTMGPTHPVYTTQLPGVISSYRVFFSDGIHRDMEKTGLSRKDAIEAWREMWKISHTAIIGFNYEGGDEND